MPIYEPRECKNQRCANTFIPSRGNQVYCCYECGKHAHNATRTARRKRHVDRTAHERNKAAWDEYNALVKKCIAETGKFPTYAEAVRMMEKEKAENGCLT